MSPDEQEAHIRAIYWILIPFSLVAIVGFFLGLLAFNVSSDPSKQIDAITISLSVLQVLLAIFALMLGIVAIFGFWAIRGAAVASAKREARDYLDAKAGAMIVETAKVKQGNGRVEKPDIPHDINEDDVLAQAKEEMEE